MDQTAYKFTPSSAGGEKWYYMDGGKKNGPIDASAIVSMLTSGELAPDTRVWTKGMEKWSPASETDLLDRANGRKGPVVVNLNTAEQPAPKRKSRWWIWLIVAVVLIAVGLAAAWFFLRPKQEAPEIPEEPVITYTVQTPVVFENDQCAFLIDEIGEKGDYLELDVRCVNKTADVLSFAWDSTCVNGSMFDPLWSVYVQGNATMKSSITFPLSTLESYNLLPAEEIKFVLSVYNEDQSSRLRSESAKYIMQDPDPLGAVAYINYKRIQGYDGYLFHKDVQVDGDGRPYYVSEDKTNVYFDEIFDSNGHPRYDFDPDASDYETFYNDSFGRPYYFSKYGATVYYEGYGFAFADEENGKNYFYDENGDPAYYGNGGIPEYYEGTVPQTLLDAGKPEKLAKADGSHIVHKEFTVYPTGKNVDEVTYPNRVFARTEQVYWNGEKGNFIVLGGNMDEFKGYIVHTYVENKSDSYVYFSWNGVVVNGVLTNPDSITALRPHSRAYRDIVIPIDVLEANDIGGVEEIDFRVNAVGENLAVPLYPIAWEATTLSGLTK